jgi:hypothetical protein
VLPERSALGSAAAQTAVVQRANGSQ